MPTTKKGPSQKEMKIATKRVQNRESCREVYRSETLHVVEYPPQVRVCKFKLHGRHSRYLLAMPFIQFARFLGSQGTSLHISFTNEPLRSIEHDVYFPLLPNVWYPSLQICLMNAPNNTFDACIKDFWNTEYLDCEDWYCYPVLEKETPIKTHHRWAKMTKEDPNFVLNVEWTHPCRLDKIPEFDVGGPQANRERVGKPEYGGTTINRYNGPIRDFAVVPYNRGSKTLD